MADPGDGITKFCLTNFKNSLIGGDDPSEELLKVTEISNLKDEKYQDVSKQAKVYAWVTPSLEQRVVDKAIEDSKTKNVKAGLKTGHDIRLREQKNFIQQVYLGLFPNWRIFSHKFQFWGEMENKGQKSKIIKK